MHSKHRKPFCFCHKLFILYAGIKVCSFVKKHICCQSNRALFKVKQFCQPSLVLLFWTQKLWQLSRNLFSTKLFFCLDCKLSQYKDAKMGWNMRSFLLWCVFWTFCFVGFYGLFHCQLTITPIEKVEHKRWLTDTNPLSLFPFPKIQGLSGICSASLVQSKEPVS